MAANMNQFMADEYVLAYHGPLLYEARVSPSFILFTSLYDFYGRRGARWRGVMGAIKGLRGQ